MDTRFSYVLFSGIASSAAATQLMSHSVTPLEKFFQRSHITQHWLSPGLPSKGVSPLKSQMESEVPPVSAVWDILKESVKKPER